MLNFRVWMLLLALGIASDTVAQEHREVLVPELVWTVVNTSIAERKPVETPGELPAAVQAGINAVLRERLGDIADSLQFSHGEIVLHNNAQVGGSHNDSNWVVPMYELRYQLYDAELGISAFEVELRVDQFGRLIYLNWPKNGFARRAALAAWPEVLEYATTYAKRRKFYSSHYKAHLRFDPSNGRLLWIFRYPVKDLSKTTMLRTLEINWVGPDLVKEYIDKY